MAADTELRRLRHFVAVVEEGTFTAAARRLEITQPALSRSIRSLEGSLGIGPLLERGRHGARPTPAGETLLHEARGVDEYVRAALARATRRGGRDRSLRVTARGCDVATLQQLVSDYNAGRGTRPDRAPARAEIVDRREQLDELRSGSADVTLVRAPFDERGLDSELLRTDTRVALLPAQHRLAGHATVDRADLAGEAFPVWPDSSAEELAFWTSTDLADHRWRAAPTVQDAAQYVGAIRLGHAVGLLPETMLAEVPLTGVCVVRVTGLSASELRVAWHESATGPDIARFVRHAAR